MNRWYRAYEGTVTDPKLSEAALVSECSRSVAVAAWHLILENACAINDGGRIDISPRRIAAALCEPLSAIEMLHSSFADLGLIAGSHVASWAKRQFESDSSTERSRRHRAKKKEKAAETLPPATDATLQDVAATDHRQRHRQKDSEADASGAEPPQMSASAVTKAIFDGGCQLLAGIGIDSRKARSIVGRWRKEYTDHEVLSALARCQAQDDISEPVEWITGALKAQRRKATGQSYGSSNNGQQPAASRGGDGFTRGLDLVDAALAHQRFGNAGWDA